MSLDALKFTDAPPVEDLPRITGKKGGRTQSQMSWLLPGHSISTKRHLTQPGRTSFWLPHQLKAGPGPEDCFVSSIFKYVIH